MWQSGNGMGRSPERATPWSISCRSQSLDRELPGIQSQGAAGQTDWCPDLVPRETEEGRGEALLPSPLTRPLQLGLGRPQAALPCPAPPWPTSARLSPEWPGSQCLRPHLPALLPTLILGRKSRSRGGAGAAPPPPLDSGPNQSCFPQCRQGEGEGPSDSPAHTGDSWANDT